MQSFDIARVREALGQTQVQFAETLGVHESTVAGWEAGRFRPRTPTVLYIERMLRDREIDPAPLRIEDVKGDGHDDDADAAA